MGNTLPMAGRRFLTKDATVAVRIKHPHDSWYAWLHREAAGISRSAYGPIGGTVVGTIAGDHLLPTGVKTGQLDGVINPLCTAQSEESLGQITGRYLGQ